MIYDLSRHRYNHKSQIINHNSKSYGFKTKNKSKRKLQHGFHDGRHIPAVDFLYGYLHRRDSERHQGDAPQAQKQTAAKPLTRVTIDANLNYYVAFGNQREKQVSFEEITPFLQDSYAKEPEMFVALYADETVPYKEIVRILNIANQNKFKMVLATRSQK